ncbi:MAG: potassium channel family protein [Thermonemataceae bacterium]
MSTKQSLKRLVFALLMFFVSILVGISGYMSLEDYTFTNAFYMSVITIATVGFAEVEPLSVSGKIFTSIYIIVNLGLFAFIISTISTYVFEGELQRVFRNYMSVKEVQKLKDHIIVCGYGRNGKKVCDELLEENKAFVLIENDPDNINHNIPNVIQTVLGDATQDEVLKKAGIERAEAIITTLPKDTDNVFISLTARELNPYVYIIARASEEQSEKKLKRAGADKVVMPDAIGGLHMAQIITKPYVIEFLNLLNGVGDLKIRLEDIKYSELKHEFHHKSLRDLNIRNITATTVIAIKEPTSGFTFNPNPNKTIDPEDILIIMGTEEAIQDFKNYYLK